MTGCLVESKPRNSYSFQQDLDPGIKSCMTQAVCVPHFAYLVSFSVLPGLPFFPIRIVENAFPTVSELLDHSTFERSSQKEENLSIPRLTVWEGDGLAQFGQVFTPGPISYGQGVGLHTTYHSKCRPQISHTNTITGIITMPHQKCGLRDYLRPAESPCLQDPQVTLRTLSFEKLCCQTYMAVRGYGVGGGQIGRLP